MIDSISKPLTLYCDNQPAVVYSSNNKSSGAAKHIDIKYHVVKDRIQDQTISIKHIRTNPCNVRWKLHVNISRNSYGNVVVGRYGGCFE